MVQHADIDHTGLPGVGAGGIDSGTSNPGSPSAGDLFFRTDHGLLIYYDGTRWLTTDLKLAPFGISEAVMPVASGGTTILGRLPVLDEFEMYLVDFMSSTLVVTTNSGSHYHTLALTWLSAANAPTTIVSHNTSADTPTNWVRHRTAIDAVLSSSARELQIARSVTGTPGTLFHPTLLSYRLVVP